MKVYNADEAFFFFEGRNHGGSELAHEHGGHSTILDEIAEEVQRRLRDAGMFTPDRYLDQLFERSIVFQGINKDVSRLFREFFRFLLLSLRAPKEPVTHRCFHSIAWASTLGLLFTEPVQAMLSELDNDGQVRPDTARPPRDHTLHPGLVYFLGQSLLKEGDICEALCGYFEHSPLGEVAAAFAPGFSLDADAIRKVFELSAIAHDCAQMPSIEATQYRIRLGHLLHRVDGLPYGSQQNLTELFREAWSELMAQWGLDSWDTERTKPVDTLRLQLEAEMCEVAAKSDYPDPGHVGGIMLLQHLANHAGRDSEAEDWHRAVALLAIVACFRHSTWTAEIAREQAWKDDPFSSYLTTIDAASEWCRISWHVNAPEQSPPSGGHAPWVSLPLAGTTLLQQLAIERSNGSGGAAAPDCRMLFHYTHAELENAVEAVMDDDKRRRLSMAFGHLLSVTVEVEPRLLA